VTVLGVTVMFGRGGDGFRGEGNRKLQLKSIELQV